MRLTKARSLYSGNIYDTPRYWYQCTSLYNRVGKEETQDFSSFAIFITQPQILTSQSSSFTSNMISGVLLTKFYIESFNEFFSKFATQNHPRSLNLYLIHSHSTLDLTILKFNPRLAQLAISIRNFRKALPKFWHSRLTLNNVKGNYNRYKFIHHS